MRRSIRFIRRAFETFWYQGFGAFLKRARVVLYDCVFRPSYKRWIRQYDTLTAADRNCLKSDIARLPSSQLISIITPVGEGQIELLQDTARSIHEQLYPNFEWLLAVGASASETVLASLRTLSHEDARIRIAVCEEPETWACMANAALAVAAGDFVAPIDPGDAFAEHALYWMTIELRANPDVDLIFSDEDKIANGVRFEPWFKTDWNPALMLCTNAFGRLGLYRRTLVKSLGGFNPHFDGAEEYELVLRCARASKPDRIRHVARILAHRGAVSEARQGTSEATKACRRVVLEDVKVRGLQVEVKPACGAVARIIYACPSSRPRVSIVIPTTARPDVLEPCLTSLLTRTSYGNYEILLLVSRPLAELSERAALLKRFGRNTNIRILTYLHRSFNFSQVSNMGAAQATGALLCFLNDDTEVLTEDWLEQLVSRVLLPQVAAAGPTLYYPDGTIQHAGVILGLGGIAGHACHRQPRGSPGYFGRALLEQDVSCVTAACMVVRADIFAAVGRFDERMPLAYNDVDLCLRMRSAGWRIIWTPAAELIHRKSASLGRHDRGCLTEQFRSDVEFMRRRWGPILDRDPFYNRNLSLKRAYDLAFPPRM